MPYKPRQRSKVVKRRVSKFKEIILDTLKETY